MRLRNVCRLTKPTALVVASLLLTGICVAPAAAQDRVDDFRLNCASCHTIGGGRLVGPDLIGVTERKDRAWLARFIVDPQSVIDSGDAYAMKILDEARGVVMTAVPGMTIDRAMNLLDLIEAESTADKSQFAGIQISDRPFTAADIATGREIFLGTQRLTKRGPSCVSCHSVNGIGVLAGGKLGPDLNAVFERLNGRKGLATWLSAPATLTMQSVYKDHPLDDDEIMSLVAFFSDKSVAPPESGQAATLIFILLGMAGTAAALVLFDVVWRRRFRAVRRELVPDTPLEGKG
ncbi:MAG: c-type cytochrome [bacterium]|nr:c-type cytochrome [bacterium]